MFISKVDPITLLKMGEVYHVSSYPLPPVFAEIAP